MRYTETAGDFSRKFRLGHLVACLRQGEPAAGDALRITPPVSGASTPTRPERLSASTLTVRIERFDLLARLLGRPPDAVHAVDRIDLTLGATHDLNLLRHVADRVAVMYLGRIVEIRDAARLAEPPYHPYTEALLSSAPALEAGLDVRRVRLAGVIPSRIGKLDGCPFESRCPRRIGAICRQAPPPEVRAGEGHVIACHLDATALERVPPIWRIKGGAGKSGKASP